MRISFAWWNTSLSPVGMRRSTGEQRLIAFEVIKYLTSQVGVDCLGLGEVTIEDVEEMIIAAELDEYEFVDGTLKKGRLQFDTGLLYRKDKFQLDYSTSIVSARGSRSLKVANRIDFFVSDTERLFHVFVSHWPSRIWCKENSADRHLLGVRLRDAIEELNKLYGSPAHTIILGDFNDEPFDPSLSQQLLACRDRNLIKKNPILLYNPFWRRIGEAVPQVPGIQCRSYSGSCFHKSGKETNWRTFDQIIFSSTFLGNSEWHLNEKYTQILQLQPFDTIITQSEQIFDHFPVISVIEREETNG
jgi:endonuclease/exonuclease/phosphatase family protein